MTYTCTCKYLNTGFNSCQHIHRPKYNCAQFTGLISMFCKTVKKDPSTIFCYINFFHMLCTQFYRIPTPLELPLPEKSSIFSHTNLCTQAKRNSSPLPECSVPYGIAECHSPCVQRSNGQAVCLLSGQVQLTRVENSVASQHRQQPILGDLGEDNNIQFYVTLPSYTHLTVVTF